MRFVVVIMATALLAGCTASAAMKEYVNQSLVQPVLRNGPPDASFDMGDGTRAFIWSMDQSYTSPGTAFTTANASAYGFGSTTNIYGSATTTYTPSTTSTWECHYVLFAKRTDPSIDGPAGWTVVDYQQPDWMCE